MKHLFVLCMIIATLSAHAQSDFEIEVVPPSYSESKASPLQYEYGDIIQIMTHEPVFLINTARYEFYQKMQKQYRDSSKVGLFEVLDLYDQMLEEGRGHYQALLDNSSQAKMLLNDIRIQRKKDHEFYNFLQMELHEKIDPLLQAVEKIEVANKKEKKREKKNRIRRGFKNFVIGGLVGASAILLFNSANK